MSRTDPTSLANAILSAPGWARVGLTAPKEHLREEAALELVRWITDREQSAGERMNDSQLALPLT